jgi:hypothetical protein
MRLAAALVLLCVLAPARADEALWKLVQGGGQVLFLRHAAPPGSPSPTFLAGTRTQPRR